MRPTQKVRELNHTELQNTHTDEVGMPMVLDPGALHHLQAAGGPPAPTQLHQQTYTYYSSSNIFERTL